MPKRTTPADYKREFIQRLRMIRGAAGLTQEEFSKKLDIARDTYAQYESRSLLPHHLIFKVCELTGHDCLFILTGRGHLNLHHPQTQSRRKVG